MSIGAPAQLDGSASTAPYGDPLSYDWSLLAVPAGSDAELSDENAVNPYFIPDQPGDYLLQLVVSDGSLESEPAIASVTASEPGEGVDLSLTISDHPDPVVRKQPVAYTLGISNQSPDAAIELRLEIEISGDIRGTPVVEGVESCSTGADGLLICSVRDYLAGNDSAQVTLTVTPKRPGGFAVEVTVSSGGEDPDPADNTVAEQTTVLK